ncbi:hypothetical protein ABE545_10705 [Sphingobacterium faecium]|jgi:hypothetical protein|uniref:hypothetical protein n=1 Tax=Sphingobacterium faecium TaxID=34087 RepID=UPI003207EDA9
MIIKRIFELLKGKAPLQQYYLELGTWLIRKGCKAQVGQIIRTKPIHEKKATQEVEVITNIFYNFRYNKLSYNTKIITLKKDEVKG